MLDVGTLLNWFVAAMSSGLLAVIVIAWLLSYREQKAAPVGPGRWLFALPAWVQMGGGLAATAPLACLGYLLVISIPLSVPVGALVRLRVVRPTVFLVGVPLL